MIYYKYPKKLREERIYNNSTVSTTGEADLFSEPVTVLALTCRDSGLPVLVSSQ